MNYKASNYYWDTVFHGKTITLAERKVMAGIALFANDKGRAEPSLKELSKRIGYSVRYIQKQIRSLREKGILYVEYQCGRMTSLGRTNRYHLNEFINVFVLFKNVIKTVIDTRRSKDSTIHTSSIENRSLIFKKTKKRKYLIGIDSIQRRSPHKPYKLLSEVFQNQNTNQSPSHIGVNSWT